MVPSILAFIKKHVKSNIFLYFIIILFFLIGISIGAFTVKVINLRQKQELVAYLKNFFNLFHSSEFKATDILIQSFITNFQLLSLNWILGIIIIGFPLIFLLITFKGFVIGFSTGLLIEEFKFKGLLIFISGILPQNLIIIPVFIVGTVISCSFTLMLIKNRINKIKQFNFFKQLITYTIFHLGLTIGIFIAACIETLLSSIFIRWLSSTII